jgi:hypothetical protein
MIETARNCMYVCLRPQHLKRTAMITLLVGTWLTFYNQGDVLLSTGLTTALILKICLNFLTPFIVSNWGLISREANGNQ